jgi:hypothetical protein
MSYDLTDGRLLVQWRPSFFVESTFAQEDVLCDLTKGEEYDCGHVAFICPTLYGWKTKSVNVGVRRVTTVVGPSASQKEGLLCLKQPSC